MSKRHRTGSKGERRIVADLERELAASVARMEAEPEHGCHEKVPHATKQLARAAAERLRHNDKGRGDDRPISVYRCRVCGFFHVGHDRYASR